MHGAEYSHILDGRIWIQVPEVKGSPAMAGEMESRLAKLNGVAHVRANPLTGYVQVLFDSQVISHYHVFAVINDLNCFERVGLRFCSLSQSCIPLPPRVSD
jgi:hypothetical protein